MPKFTRQWRCVAALLVTISVASCYNDFDDIAATENQDVTTNITTAELSRRVSADGYVDITDDIRLRGNVSAHDKSGNFYKTFFIEDGGYGVEIMEGITDSYVRHELGYEVVIQLNGLRVSRSRGVVQIGVATSAGSYYDLDYMGHELIVDRHITNTGYVKPVEPREFTIAELSANPQLASEICGSLIRITGLKYHPTEEEDDGLWSGNRCFIAADDPLIDGEPEASIWCYTSSYANFCAVAIPNQTGSITGVLQGDNVDGGEGWEMMIKPRDVDDLAF